MFNAGLQERLLQKIKEFGLAKKAQTDALPVITPPGGATESKGCFPEPAMIPAKTALLLYLRIRIRNAFILPAAAALC